MDFFDELSQQTRAERDYLLAAPIIAQASSGKVSLPSYVAFLSQAYHHVKHTTPLLMACGARLPERLEWLREAVAEYIEEELGHQEWVLNDIRACGADAEAVRAATPNIQRNNPVSFFGMVHVLEGTSIALATQMAGVIKGELGLPPQAFSYLTSHGSLDVGHVEFFKKLMNRLESPEDKAAVVHTAKVVYHLYGDMFRSLPLSA